MPRGAAWGSAGVGRRGRDGEGQCRPQPLLQLRGRDGRRGRPAEPARGRTASATSVGSGLWGGLWLSGTWADLGSGEGRLAATGSGALCFF